MENQFPSTLNDSVFSLAVDQSKEGIAIHDNHGIFLYVNPSMASMYGYKPEEVLGHSWRIFYKSEQIRQIESEHLPILLSEGHWRGELKGLKKSGELFDVDISLTVLRDDHGNPAGLVCRSQDISDSKRIQMELTTQKQRYQLVFDHSPVLIAHIGLDCRYQIVNKQYCRWLGKHPDQIIGSHIEHILSESAFAQAKPKIDSVLSGQEVDYETKVRHASGAHKWVKATYIPDRDSEGNVNGFCAFIVDIDERKRKEFSHQTLLLAIERGMEGLALHDKDGNFTYVNPSQANMYGYEPDELLGRRWNVLYDTEQAAVIENQYLPLLFAEGQWRGELNGRKKTGEYFDVEVSLTLLKDESGDNAGLFCSCRDISERKRSQKKLDFLAYNDHLTGLPNRLFFRERLEQALVRARSRADNIAVLFIDLDHFKYINDTLGHSIGDQLLKEVADRIKSTFRGQDTVARLSGDEFTVLMCDFASLPVIDQVVDKLIQAFRTPIHVGHHEFYQGISVGISVYPRDGEDVEALMKNADAAMYRAKEDGRQGYRYYIPSLTDSAYESMLLKTQLQNAIDKGEFELHYQPLVSLENNCVIGFEALIRWHHPELGLVSPDKFIRHAEESNLIVPIGYWVVEEVCRQLKIWQANGLDAGAIAINVSGVQLNPRFADKIKTILNDTETATDRIEFEITETFLMKGLKQPVEQLNKLRALGIKLAIDDFGVGYSSLSQLKQLPTQCLKIDRSFVRDIVDDLDDRAIVEAIIVLGKTLKLEITAEGVETAEQHALLRQLGCKKAQGYFYAKPGHPDEILDLCNELDHRIRSL